MERIEPTRRFALKVWWALAWRFALASIVLLFIEGLIIATLIAMFELKPESAQRLTRAFSIFVGMPLVFWASWEVLYRIFYKRIDNCEIAVLHREEGD
jgi:hypothetical protein